MSEGRCKGHANGYGRHLLHWVHDHGTDLETGRVRHEPVVGTLPRKVSGDIHEPIDMFWFSMLFCTVSELVLDTCLWSTFVFTGCPRDTEHPVLDHGGHVLGSLGHQWLIVATCQQLMMVSAGHAKGHMACNDSGWLRTSIRIRHVVLLLVAKT